MPNDEFSLKTCCDRQINILAMGRQKQKGVETCWKPHRVLLSEARLGFCKSLISNLTWFSIWELQRNLANFTSSPTTGTEIGSREKLTEDKCSATASFPVVCVNTKRIWQKSAKTVGRSHSIHSVTLWSCDGWFTDKSLNPCEQGGGPAIWDCHHPVGLFPFLEGSRKWISRIHLKKVKLASHS